MGARHSFALALALALAAAAPTSAHVEVRGCIVRLTPPPGATFVDVGDEGVSTYTVADYAGGVIEIELGPGPWTAAWDDGTIEPIEMPGCAEEDLGPEPPLSEPDSAPDVDLEPAVLEDAPVAPGWSPRAMWAV